MSLEGFEIHLNHLNLVSHLELLEVFPGLFDRLVGYEPRALGQEKDTDNSHPSHDSGMAANSLAVSRSSTSERF